MNAIVTCVCLFAALIDSDPARGTAQRMVQLALPKASMSVAHVTP